MADDSEADVAAISALLSALKPLDRESKVRVLDFVTKKLGISTNTPSEEAYSFTRPITQPTEPSHALPSAGSRVHDIRSFAAEKQPRTVNERVAVIGYYLAHLAPETERRDHLVSDDIKTYFIQANFDLPTGPANMTLTNAKNAGYLNALDRGQYRLNAVGYNLVVHKLPSADQGGIKRKTVRRPAKKKARTKARR